MTWLDIDTLDLKYRKGQVWRISDTCYVYDVQAGDILDVPFVVSAEYNDVLIGYDLTGLTLEQVLECKALWVQKQYATFYEALNAFVKLGAGLLERINKHQVRINVTGRVMLVRQSEMRQQKFLQLAQSNPMQAIQYLLHRIQTEPTAVVPVMRDKVVVPEAPKVPEKPKGFNAAVLANYKPLTALSTSMRINKESPALEKLLSELYFKIDDFSNRAIQYLYALYSMLTYKVFKENNVLGAFNQVPFIDPVSLLAAGRYSGTFNSYSEVFGAAEDLQYYPQLTVKTVALNDIPEQSDSIIRCVLDESLVGTICLWLVPKHLNTGLRSSIGVAPVKDLYSIGLYPEGLRVYREPYWDTSKSKQDYLHILDTTSIQHPKPTGAAGTILEYTGADTVEYTLHQDAYGETTVRFKGKQLSSKVGLSDWVTEFDVSKVLKTYAQDISSNESDMRVFEEFVSTYISPAYKSKVLYLTSTGRTYNADTAHSAKNGSYSFLDADYSWIEYPTKVPPDPYPKSSNVNATLSYSGLVSITTDVQFNLLAQSRDELDELHHINQLMYSTAEDATISLQYKYIPRFKFYPANSPDSLLFKAKGT